MYDTTWEFSVFRYLRTTEGCEDRIFADHCHHGPIADKFLLSAEEIRIQGAVNKVGQNRGHWCLAPVREHGGQDLDNDDTQLIKREVISHGRA